MNNPVILKKLESLNRCLNRLEEKRPKSVNELKGNWDLQDIISINLERAVQISVDIASVLIADRGWKSPETMGEGFLLLADKALIPLELAEKLKQSVGFRNISVHEYQSIDWVLVFEILQNHLGNFKAFAKAILAL